MAKVQTINVKKRDAFGKRRNRRLRNEGNVPAVLYGHKQAVQPLTISAEEIEAVVRHGNRFVELAGELREKAFIKDVQWNTWGTQILHVDFARVSEHEKVQVTIPVELRGDAPGTKDGGVVKHVLHSIELVCEAAAIPEKLEVNINHLEFNQVIHVVDLELPAGATTTIEPTAVVVSCSLPTEVSEEVSTDDDTQPEIIGRRKPTDEEGEE